MGDWDVGVYIVSTIRLDLVSSISTLRLGSSSWFIVFGIQLFVCKVVGWDSCHQGRCQRDGAHRRCGHFDSHFLKYQSWTRSNDQCRSVDIHVEKVRLVSLVLPHLIFNTICLHLNAPSLHVIEITSFPLTNYRRIRSVSTSNERWRTT